ncbi:MAG: hypothetical protein HQL67_12240 [Magnetococcales bacterium]|nr:hypothetical protein [Magnetococcales bacterium]
MISVTYRSPEKNVQSKPVGGDAVVEKTHVEANKVEAVDEMEKSSALLDRLEQKMDALNELVSGLRLEKVSLTEKLENRDDNYSRLQQENAELKSKMAELTEEKEKTILKLETLLARFDGSGQ